MNDPIIYQYLEYRMFLKDLFDYKKSTNKNFSHRFFAKKAGFNTSNFLSLVTSGKRNLTISSIAKIAKGFNFSKQEREYFENLVLMNQAKTHEEKDYYYKKMIAEKGFKKFQEIGKDSYDYFSKWYTPVIREIIALGDRNHTPEQIAEMLNPMITPQMAKDALDILLRLNLIRKDENGLWEKCDEVVTTGPEVRSILASNYHNAMLKCATQSLQRYPSSMRDISAVVLSISKSALPELKSKIAEFRQELLKFACAHRDADLVVQVNTQAFPMTHPIVCEKVKKD